jgi:S1-C subfamily serine protease
MSADHEPDDDRPVGDDPLPPEDRLWRHPSELAAGINPPGAWFDAPARATSSLDVRRTLLVGAVAGACLAGAVMAAGAMWFTRPAHTAADLTPASTVRKATPATSAMFTFRPFPTEHLAAALGAALPAVRVLKGGVWLAGSGFWLDDRGTVVTATPLVQGAVRIEVTGDDGVPQLVNKVFGVDPATGITTMRVDHTAGKQVATTTASPRNGQAVAIVGAPNAPAGSSSPAATVAPASVWNGSMRSTVGAVAYHDTMQLDRAVPMAAIGGLVVDAQGRPVGISIGNSGSREGVAVPADTALAAAIDLRDDGKVERAWLGVRAADLEPSEAAMLGLAGGAKLTRITAGSPAERAGLRRGDVVTAVGDTPIGDASDLVNALRDLDPGDHISVAIRRGLQDDDKVVTLGGP